MVEKTYADDEGVLTADFIGEYAHTDARDAVDGVVEREEERAFPWRVGEDGDRVCCEEVGRNDVTARL